MTYITVLKIEKCQRQWQRSIVATIFHTALRPRSLAPFNLFTNSRSKERPQKLHNPGKFPEDGICSSHFRDSQKLMQCQKQSFWANFGWFLMDYSPKWGSVCTKVLLVIQSKVTHYMTLQIWKIPRI